MELKIDISNAHKIKQSSFHKHDQWEIIFYIEGDGFFCTPTNRYSFKRGSVFFVPPGVIHRSVSEEGFNNMYVRGNFEHLIMFDDLLTVEDNAEHDGEFFIHMLYRNRYRNSNYLSDLCTAYIHFLLQEAHFKNGVERTIHKICSQIAENAFDHNIDITQYLKNSGYAEDYIRMRFKEIIGMSPLKFLTKIRIERACTLLEMYKDQFSLMQVAEKCGYTDYVYFSKKFKQQVGISPQKYIETLTVQAPSLLTASESPQDRIPQK